MFHGLCFNRENFRFTKFHESLFRKIIKAFNDIITEFHRQIAILEIDQQNAYANFSHQMRVLPQ